MKPAMYLFINEGLRMSPGKIAAQAAHAAVEAYEQSLEYPRYSPLPGNQHATYVDHWNIGRHYTKLVMSARDTEHLRSIESYLNDRNFHTRLIVDEGHTEVPPITPTALGVEVVDRDDPHTAATFESFDLLKAPRPSDPSEASNRLKRSLARLTGGR